MPTLLRFLPTFRETVLPQRCYWKPRWQDYWIETSELWCNFAEWSAAPSVPVAELEFRYGRGLSEGGTAFAARFRESQRARYYVKVEYDTHTLNAGGGGGIATWIGTLEIEQDSLHGALKHDGQWYANGKAFFSCFGLEQQLQFTEVTTSRILMESGEEITAQGLTFNGDEQRNQTLAKGSTGTYLFEGRPGEPAADWHTRDIVEYLLSNHRPTDFNGQAWLPFDLDDADNVLPTWDRPIVRTHGQSVRELLNSLISRNRLLSYRLVVTDDGIAVRPFSFTDEAIYLDEPYGAVINANPNTIRIAAERDSGATLVVKRSSIDAVDQVIAEGAPRTSTATHSFAEDSLEEGWWGDLSSEHDEGGVSDGAYPAADEVELRQQFTILFRQRDKFRGVYRRFILPADWDGLVGDGVGGDRVPLMPVDGNPNSPAALGLEHRKFTPALALLEDYDYSDATNPVEQLVGVLHNHRPPLVLFPTLLPEGETRPEDLDDWTWTTGDNASLTLGLETLAFPFSVRASAGRDGALFVDVQNNPQYLIASDDFVPIDGIDPELPFAITFRQMLVTLTMEWSQRASGRYPADGALPFGQDVVRRLTIDAGPTYRCDYLVGNTVVGLNPDGTLIHAVTANAGEYIQDDRRRLQGIAQVAFAWYGRTRRAVDLKTSLITSAVQIGQYVTALGDTALEGDLGTEEVNSVVSSIRIESRSTESDAASRGTPTIPTMTVVTAFGELDLLRIGKR